MAQIFIFGASTVYGVGAEACGWGDLLKRKLHMQMYGTNGIGEKHEVYNFGKPGATVGFVLKTFDSQIQNYAKNGPTIAIVSVGLNNSRAADSAENYVTPIEEFKQIIEELLVKVIAKVDHVICVGYTPVDEKKTTPKPNSTSGGTSYFWNERIEAFNKIFMEVCKAKGVTFVQPSIDPETWKAEYLYIDGLHPNQKGHQFIFENVQEKLEDLLEN